MDPYSLGKFGVNLKKKGTAESQVLANSKMSIFYVKVLNNVVSLEKYRYIKHQALILFDEYSRKSIQWSFLVFSVASFICGINPIGIWYFYQAMNNIVALMLIPFCSFRLHQVLDSHTTSNIRHMANKWAVNW